MIELKQVYKSFDQIKAVTNLTLHIEKNAIVGLIGPNGAGKTSLLRILATLYKPDSGKVEIHGEDITTHPWKIRPKIGFMPNDFGSFGDMTVRDYIRFFGTASGIPWNQVDRRVDEILELTDLQGRAEQLVQEGSTGIKQRACLAKTLVHNPDILLLDEPASGLDPRARIEIRELLKELRSLNKTILLSSHILADLEEVCTHYAFMDKGKLLNYGSKEELLNKRKEKFQFRLEIPSQQEALFKTFLSENTNLRSVLEKPGGYFELESEVWTGNQVLQWLLEKQIEVLSFGKHHVDLEDIFLQITGRFS